MAATAVHIFATFYVNSFLLIVESHKIKSYRQFIGKSSHNSKFIITIEIMAIYV
jgi:hypothetical protein